MNADELNDNIRSRKPTCLRSQTHVGPSWPVHSLFALMPPGRLTRTAERQPCGVTAVILTAAVATRSRETHGSVPCVGGINGSRDTFCKRGIERPSFAQEHASKLVRSSVLQQAQAFSQTGEEPRLVPRRRCTSLTPPSAGFEIGGRGVSAIASLALCSNAFMFRVSEPGSVSVASCIASTTCGHTIMSPCRPDLLRG